MAIIKPNNNTISAITALPSGMTSAPGLTTGSLVFINTQTVSGDVSSVNFDNLMSSTYDNYVIFFHKVGHDHAGNAVMRSQLGYGSTPTYLTGNNYKFTYIYHQAQSDGTDTINGAGVGGSTSYFQYGLTNRSSTSNGSIFLTGMNNTGSWQKGVRSDYFHHGQNANDFEHAYMSCVANDSNATTSIKFYFSSGNVSSGVFTLYGVKKS
tara:strand:- start:212 stop:838 length:627 start_codon:yes stop_codon:yes gene_type:complete